MPPHPEQAKHALWKSTQGPHRAWRGPARDSAVAITPLNRGNPTSDKPLNDDQCWSPFDSRSRSWQSGSLLRVASEHREAVSQLNGQSVPLLYERTSRGPELRRSQSDAALAYQSHVRRPHEAPTMLYRAHVWPPHTALSPRGRHRPAATRPPPPEPNPLIRFRSPLRDPRTTDVFGAPITDAPSPRKPRHLMRDYQSPRPSPSSYGMESTHAGVGRAGYWQP